MVPSAEALRIAILGVGRIGSTFAFQLSAVGGHDVTVIARPESERLQQLQRDGAIVDTQGARASVGVAETLDEQVPYDLVIVTLLAHQVESLLPSLHRSAAKSIQFMFNTFDPERLQDVIGAERCTFGMPFVQALLSDDGKLTSTIGAGGQKTLMGRQRWVDVFNAAGLPAALESNMPLWLRCHAPLCVAFESVSIAGMQRGGGASWREAMVLARGVHAGFHLIESLGHTVYPTSKKVMARSPSAALAAILWSLSRVRSFREVLATGKAECSALVDTMAASATGALPPASVAKIAAMKPVPTA